MFWPINSSWGNRKMVAAAGLASKQFPALSAITIPSRTFRKMDENSQSVLRKAWSACRCWLRKNQSE